MSQNYTVPLQYGPDGCRICGEMQTLDIIKEFNRFYESKLQEINSIGGGDGLQAKVMLQQNWIRDLTQQNEMLVKVVEQLEKVAADRVSMLEEHLQNSTSVGAKVMQRYKDNFSIYLNETFQKMEWLQSDVCNLINFVKRVRDYNEWNVKGLKFYTLNPNILLSNCDCVTCEYPSSLIEPPVQDSQANKDMQKLDTKLKDMEELSHSPKDVEELNFKLHLKDEELSSVKRRSMDIETDCNELRKKFKESEKENQSLKDTIFQANRELEKLYDQANEYLKERDNFKQKFKSSLDQLDMLKNQNSFDRQQLESQSCIFEETIEKLNNENKKVKDELVNIKLQNESLSQAQNETIQALQEAIHEKDKPSLQSKALPFATSDASWLSVSESDKLLDKCVDGKTSNLADVASLMLNKSEFEVCSTSTCPPTCYGVEELEKLQKEREIERQKHLKEVDNLKKTIKELESNSSGTETTKLLEEVQVKAKLEISRQRTTISNLQDALKTCKNQLDEIKQKSSSDVSFGWATKWLGLSSTSNNNNNNSNIKSVHDI